MDVQLFILASNITEGQIPSQHVRVLFLVVYPFPLRAGLTGKGLVP